MLDNGPDTQVVPVVDGYQSSVLAQLNVMTVLATSPTRVTPVSKTAQSGSVSKTKRPCKQSDIKLKTPKKKLLVSAATTSKAKRRSNAAVVGREGGGVSQSVKGRTTGARAQAAQKLVLSVVPDGSSDQGARSSSEEMPKRVVRKAKRFMPESSDDS